MFLSLLLLGSVGILMASLTDSLDEEEVHLESDEAQEIHSVDEEQDGAVALGVVEGLESSESPNASGSNLDSEAELTGPESQASEFSAELTVPEGAGIESCAPQALDIFRLDLTSANTADSSEPLADFNSNPDTPILNINEFDYISVGLNLDDGSIGILRADYLERSDDDDGSELESLHTGVNFYFIPNGETFPEDYVWSSDSAALYNGQSYVNDSTDFGEIRLVLRVDTGFLYGASSYDAEVQFSDQVFVRLEELIIGNGNFHQI